MAFPYVFQGNFEDGTLGNFDSETDTASQLDFPHYTELARYPQKGMVPYAGAYAMRVALTGGTADAYLVEADVNIAAAATNYFRFPLYISPDFAATADDTINILELLASATVEACFGLRIVAATGVINFGVGETAPTDFTSFAIERGVWYTVELLVTVDDGASNDGVISLYVTRDGNDHTDTVEATVTALDQGAITDARFGVQDHLATTTGTLLFHGLTQDDGRLYPEGRYLNHKNITINQHLFVGRGDVDLVALLKTSATNEVARLYDTDHGEAHDLHFVCDLRAGATEMIDTTLHFSHGCFISLTGTNPVAGITIHGKGAYRTHDGPQAYNDALVKAHGLRAKAH